MNHISNSRHKRDILKKFPPFLNDDELYRMEKQRFVLRWVFFCLVAAPTVLMVVKFHKFTRSGWFIIMSIIFGYRFFESLHRLCILWPEGQSLRWNYWQEIETMNPILRLKLLGMYFTKIDKYLKQFPEQTPVDRVMNYYRVRWVFNACLFFAAYGVFLTFLILSKHFKTFSLPTLYYVMCVGCAIVLVRMTESFIIDLPQAIKMSQRPELGSEISIENCESVPLAQPLENYNTLPSINVEKNRE